MTKYKLTVADVVEFEVKFTLNDKGEARNYGLRCSANRVPQDKLNEEFKQGLTVGEFLKRRTLTMQAWIGKPPLVDAESGQDVPAGEAALDALMDMVGGMVSLIYAGFLEANGARGKAGN